MKRFLLVVGVLVCMVALPVFAARKERPAGREIAEKAKAAKLDRGSATTGEKGGKRITITPAILDQLKNETELEDGQVIGLLETEAAGDETALAPGTYNLFLAKVGNKWHAYAESGGKIAAEAVRVNLEKTDKPAGTKPEVITEGWCLRLTIAGWFIGEWCF